jgi:hypothetical protein
MSEFADSRTDLSSSTIEIIFATRLPAVQRTSLPQHCNSEKIINLCFRIVMTIPYGNLANLLPSERGPPTSILPETLRGTESG